VKHTVTHDLPPDLARKAAEAAIRSYTERFSEYHPTVQWITDQLAEVAFKVKGVTLKAKVELHDRGIAAEMDVPFLLRMFQSKATEIIDGEIQRWIGKAKAGELG
jgi:hypothetical protein